MKQGVAAYRRALPDYFEEVNHVPTNQEMIELAEDQIGRRFATSKSLAYQEHTRALVQVGSLLFPLFYPFGLNALGRQTEVHSEA